MPFKSEAQRRLFYAKAKRGEISEETLKQREDETPKGKKLPERLEKSAFFLGFEKAGMQFAPVMPKSPNVGVSQSEEASKAFASPSQKMEQQKAVKQVTNKVVQQLSQRMG